MSRSLPYELAALELAGQALTRGERVRMTVNGQSMAPLLRPGDVVEVEPAAPEAFTPGEILLARRVGDFVLHRLILVSAEGWVLKGDENSLPDPVLGRSAVLGRAVERERQGARFSLTTPAVRRLNRRLARLGGWEADLYRRIYAAADGAEAAWLARLVIAPIRLAARLLQWGRI
jgi:hypothetical protein